jgi:hypothetical protein
MKLSKSWIASFAVLCISGINGVRAENITRAPEVVQPLLHQAVNDAKEAMNYYVKRDRGECHELFKSAKADLFKINALHGLYDSQKNQAPTQNLKELQSYLITWYYFVQVDYSKASENRPVKSLNFYAPYVEESLGLGNSTQSRNDFNLAQDIVGMAMSNRLKERMHIWPMDMNARNCAGEYFRRFRAGR